MKVDSLAPALKMTVLAAILSVYLIRVPKSDNSVMPLLNF